MRELYCAPSHRRGVLQAICDKKSLKFQLPLAFSIRLVQPSQALARAVGGINLNFAPQAKYIGRAWIGTLRAGAFAQRVRIIAARIPISLLFVRLNMRSISILALLLIVVGVQPATAQPLTGYCRIYRCMTIGTSACYYCLPCDSCTTAMGYIGGWNESTGACVACGTTGADHCLFGAGAPTGPVAPPPPDAAPAPPGRERTNRAPETAPYLTTVAALTEEPEVLYNPDFSDNVKKWDLTIEIPGEGTVKALLVTATVKPKKKGGGGGHHEQAFLGFAVRYSGDLSAYPAVTAVSVGPHGTGHKFKFEEEDGTLHNKKCTIGPAAMMP